MKPSTGVHDRHEPLRLSWRDRLRSRIGMLLFWIIGIRSGPAMIGVRGEWLYIDFTGRIYRLSPSYLEGSPLVIEVLSEPRW